MDLLNFLKTIETTSEVFTQSRQLFAGDRRLRAESAEKSVTEDQKQPRDQKSGLSVTDQKLQFGYSDDYFTGVRAMLTRRCPHPFCEGVAPVLPKFKAICFACVDREQTGGRVGIMPINNPGLDPAAAANADRNWCHMVGCFAVVLKDIGKKISIDRQLDTIDVDGRSYKLKPLTKEWYKEDVRGTIRDLYWNGEELYMNVDGLDVLAPKVYADQVSAVPVAYPPLPHPRMDVREYLPEGPLTKEPYTPQTLPPMPMRELVPKDFDNAKQFQQYQQRRKVWMEQIATRMNEDADRFRPQSKDEAEKKKTQGKAVRTLERSQEFDERSKRKAAAEVEAQVEVEEAEAAAAAAAAAYKPGTKAGKK